MADDRGDVGNVAVERDEGGLAVVRAGRGPYDLQVAQLIYPDILLHQFGVAGVRLDRDDPAAFANAARQGDSVEPDMRADVNHRIARPHQVHRSPPDFRFVAIADQAARGRRDPDRIGAVDGPPQPAA